MRKKLKNIFRDDFLSLKIDWLLNETRARLLPLLKISWKIKGMASNFIYKSHSFKHFPIYFSHFILKENSVPKIKDRRHDIKSSKQIVSTLCRKIGLAHIRSGETNLWNKSMEKNLNEEIPLDIVVFAYLSCQRCNSSTMQYGCGSVNRSVLCRYNTTNV